MFKNLIGGEWVEGPRVSRNINPSDTRDVVGEWGDGPRVSRWMAPQCESLEVVTQL